MEKDTKALFQITEAAHACGLSRSTLMRLEKKGLLVPAYIAPESGRRYYDNFNVARILQVEKFQAMGLNAEEIATYFIRGGEASALLAALEKRLLELQRSVEEMRLRAAEGPSISVQVMQLPAVTCCIRWCKGIAYEERYAAMFAFYSECIRKGYVLSKFRIGRTIWRAASAANRTPMLSAFPCGRRRRRQTRWCCRNAARCRCCTAATIPAWTKCG